MKPEINEEFLIEYVDGILKTIVELHSELKANFNEFSDTMLFGLRTALFQLQNQLILWHPKIDSAELLNRFHLNFDVETLLNKDTKVPYIE